MPISEQVLHELRAVLRRTQDGLADSSDTERFVFEALPELLDEVERERAVHREVEGIQHVAPELLRELLTSAAAAVEVHPDRMMTLPARQVRDLAGHIRYLQGARHGLRSELRQTNELATRLSLDLAACAAQRDNDTVLAKDFLALYTSARSLTTGWEPQAPRLNDLVEHLGLLVRRLAPLYDDVRRTLALRQREDVATLTLPIGDRLALVLRELAPLVGVPFCDVALLALVNGTDDLLDRFVADDAVIARLRTEVQASVDEAARAARARLDRPEAERTLRAAGFPRLADLVQRGTPDMRTVVQQQVARHVAAGIIDAGALPAPSRGVEQVEVVSIPLGPVLLARTQALVASGRLGRSLGNVAQTLFILGLLEVEGQDPRAHFGEPKQHISVDGAFLRFALPHSGPERENILRSLFAWLHAWLGDEDPLAKAPAAALAALPR